MAWSHGRTPEPLEDFVFAWVHTTLCSSVLSRKEDMHVSEFIGIVCEPVLFTLFCFIITIFPNAFSELAKNWQISLQKIIPRKH